MFFGFESRPDFLPQNIKIRREVKCTCSPGKKCRGSMSALSMKAVGQMSVIQGNGLWNKVRILPTSQMNRYCYDET
jgi:hypothetical protein